MMPWIFYVNSDIAHKGRELLLSDIKFFSTKQEISKRKITEYQNE